MPLIDDFLSGIYSALYGIISFLAGGMWLFDRLFIMVGYCLMAIDNWLVGSLFSPLIQSTNQSLFRAFNGMFLIALFVLGLTYMISHIIQLNVVTLGKALTWWMFGMLFFSLGPQLYQGMQDLRGGIQTFFYTSVLTQVNSNTGSSFNSLNNVKSNSDYDLPMYAVCDNFSRYLGRTGPDRRTGLDAALAFLRADGIDVMGYAPAGGLPADCDIHKGGITTFLPAEWFTLTVGNTLGPEMESKEKGSYFASEKAPGSGWWNNTMNVSPVDTINNHRMNSLEMAGTGFMRLFFVQPVIWYGIAEQFVNVLLTIAQALTFISMAIAILFAFFRRTEGIALAILDQWIQLIIVTMVLSVLSALIAGLFMIGANSGNVFGTFGMSIVALVFTVFMLMIGFRTVYNASNKLFDAMGQATGGSVISMGKAAGMVAGAAGAVATGGATFLAANAVDDVSTQQAAAMGVGAMFSGNQALSGAARMIKMLPGATDTQIGGLVMDMAAGEAFTRMGNAMGGTAGALISGGVVLPEYLRQLNRAGMSAEGFAEGQLPPNDSTYIDDEGYEYEPPRPRRPKGGAGKPKAKRPPIDGDPDDDDGVEADANVFDGLAVPLGRLKPVKRYTEDELEDVPSFDYTNRAIPALSSQVVADSSSTTLSNEQLEKLDDRMDAEGDQVADATTRQMINDNRKADRLEQEMKESAAAKGNATTGPSADAEAAILQKQELAIGEFERATHDLGRTAQQLEMNDKLRREAQNKDGGAENGESTNPKGSVGDVSDKQTGAMSGSESILGKFTVRGSSPYVGADGVVQDATSVGALMGRTLATVQQDRMDADQPIHGAVNVKEGKAALYDAVGVQPASGIDPNSDNRVSVPGWVAPVSLANELGLSPQQLQTAVTDVQTRRDHGLSKETRTALIDTAGNYTNYPETRVSDLERSIQNLPKEATFTGTFTQPTKQTPSAASSGSSDISNNPTPSSSPDAVSMPNTTIGNIQPPTTARTIPQAIQQMTAQNWANQTATRQQQAEEQRLADQRYEQHRAEAQVAPSREAEAFLREQKQVDQVQGEADRAANLNAAQAASIPPQPSMIRRVMGASSTPKNGGESNTSPLAERPGTTDLSLAQVNQPMTSAQSNIPVARPTVQADQPVMEQSKSAVSTEEMFGQSSVVQSAGSTGSINQPISEQSMPTTRTTPVSGSKIAPSQPLTPVELPSSPQAPLRSSSRQSENQQINPAMPTKSASAETNIPKPPMTPRQPVSNRKVSDPKNPMNQPGNSELSHGNAKVKDDKPSDPMSGSRKTL